MSLETCRAAISASGLTDRRPECRMHRRRVGRATGFLFVYLVLGYIPA
ncbi:hypothetical protein [Nannocystis pusilla]